MTSTSIIKSDLYKVDLEEIQNGEFSPKYIQIDDAALKAPLLMFFLAKPKEEQIKYIVPLMVRLIGNFPSIGDQEIRKYVERAIQEMDTERLHSCLLQQYAYSELLKKKIRRLADEHAGKKFKEMILAGKIHMQFEYALPTSIVPGKLGNDIANSLYEREGEMNNFEVRVISELAALPNIAFWHRNLGRGRGFAVNGFKNNHYPDFIILTQSGKIILLETKGDDRDNSDIEAKSRLGMEWAHLAGKDYRYFMVFDNRNPDDTHNIDGVKGIIKQL